MPNNDLVNRDLAFLNEYRTSIGIKLLLLHVLCYTTNDPSAQRKQFFADSKDALKLYRRCRQDLDLLTKWRANPFCGKMVIGGMQHDGTPK